jgi:hypothetical protein
MRSAAQLRITEAERTALMFIHDMLLSGEIRHHQETEEPVGNQLNMAVSGESDFSGARACIGGFVSGMMGPEPTWGSGVIRIDAVKADLYVESGHSPALTTLYRPLRTRFGASIVRADGEPLDYPWELITPREAAAAVHNFLYLGKPHWSDVLFDNLPKADPGIVFPEERLVELFDNTDLREAA